MDNQKLIDINTIIGRRIYLKLCARVIHQAVNDAKKTNDIGKHIHVAKADEQEAKYLIQNLDSTIFADLLKLSDREIKNIQEEAQITSWDEIAIPHRRGDPYPEQSKTARHWYTDGKVNRVFRADNVPGGWHLGKSGTYGNQYSKGVINAAKD